MKATKEKKYMPLTLPITFCVASGNLEMENEEKLNLVKTPYQTLENLFYNRKRNEEKINQKKSSIF